MNPNIEILPEDDPATLKCAANLLARFTNRMLNPARLPNMNETNKLIQLQNDLKTKFGPQTIESIDGESLLKRLWYAFYGKNVKYSRYSKKWSQMGFQHNKDPTSDIRGGGILSLQCLVYFFEKQPGIARHMFSERAIRITKRGEFANYPFACAGITLVKKLCELLMICEPITGKVTNRYEETALTYWHIIGSRVSFYELFVWSFMILDKVWDEMNATYMNFGVVIRIVMQRIENVLNRLPTDVVPSSRSYNIDEDHDYQANEYQCIYEENAMCIDSDNDDDDEEEERKEEENIYQSPSPSSYSTSSQCYSSLPMPYDSVGEQQLQQCLTGDLLGLDSFYDSSSQSLLSNEYKQQEYSSYSQTQEEKFRIPNPNFFEEFGLDT
jgi:hypothetical protein